MSPRVSLPNSPRSGLCFRVFFFQAEDGIRDLTVTGVQTCALPISPSCDAELRTLFERAPVQDNQPRAHKSDDRRGKQGETDPKKGPGQEPNQRADGPPAPGIPPQRFPDPLA